MKDNDYPSRTSKGEPFTAHYKLITTTKLLWSVGLKQTLNGEKQTLQAN
jgi:carotenoid cleavage dioxygenase-like enzyme